jgi:hypothetical protein
MLRGQSMSLFLNKDAKAPLHYLNLKRETIPIKKMDIIQGEERLKTE